MNLFNIIAILITIAAIFSFVNYRYLKLPTTIGLMAIALLMSLILIGLAHLGVPFDDMAVHLLEQIDFNKTLLHGMLSFLLFAGALHINLDDLSKQKWVIASLATIGVTMATFIIGYLSWWLFGMLGMQIPLIYCLLFGALISPTDPIAVLGILKTANIPKTLETKIAGESLFNDGVAVVIFIVLLEFVTGEQTIAASDIAIIFLQEAVGGVVYGLIIGALAYWMLKQVDNYSVEIMITLALVTGGYALAGSLHLSGPIAIVVAGLLIGNHGRLFAMSDRTREHLDTFWELVDEILNAVLFVLIGLEVLVLSFASGYILASLLCIPLVILARFASVSIPVITLRRFRTFTPGIIKILTWGGLRGGISVALALSLPMGPERDLILAVTYAVVVFSILVQGLTIKNVVSKSQATA
jgi:CPA1 family monovalent cation:H+ antiporter